MYRLFLIYTMAIFLKASCQNINTTNVSCDKVINSQFCFGGKLNESSLNSQGETWLISVTCDDMFYWIQAVSQLKIVT